MRLKAPSPKIDLLRSLCRKHGMRLTPQRLEIFRAIDDVCDHPSAYDVYNRVSSLNPSITLDTVYRTLDTFEKWGILKKLSFLFDKIRYDANLHSHYHFLCTECKNIMDFEWPEFSDMEIPAEVSRWGKPEKKDILVEGVCSTCLAKSSRPLER